MTDWVFLSPHLDDAVFSCGGLIYEQSAAGDSIQIWTICAGEPSPGPLSDLAKSLHASWGLDEGAVTWRRAEDERACAAVGAGSRHFDLQDCIYRRDPVTLDHLYKDEAALFGEPAAVEVERLAPALAARWEQELPRKARVVVPLGLGGHVDHQLVRLAADRLARPRRYYADAPYVFSAEAQIPDALPAGARPDVLPISDAGLRAWIAGNAAYASQLSSFWEDAGEMERLFREYAARNGGVRLWQSGG